MVDDGDGPAGRAPKRNSLGFNLRSGEGEVVTRPVADECLIHLNVGLLE